MERARTSDAKDSGYRALFEKTAIVDLGGWTVLRLSGRDPAGMLDAVLTRNLPKEENGGVYAALLNPKGRIQTDLRAVRCEGGVLVVTGSAGGGAAREILGRYAPFSRVRLEDLSAGEERWSVLGLYGPDSRDLLGLPEMAEHEGRPLEPGLIAVRVELPVSGYDLIGARSALARVRRALENRGAVVADERAYEAARISAGIPRFGVDLTPENFPGECPTFLRRAVSFEKGCYPGQETVSRMHYRGHPNRTLHRFEVEGNAPQTGAPITQRGEEVGRVTSVAPLPVGGRVFALGYLSRRAEPKDEPLYASSAVLHPSDPPGKDR
ncbi:YgfZ/GcvT domain-containing protein [Rubrobacter naiadicus]|uniref:CAF17-like 4Fe-4S cluster assembly/insertion protein YgfZ n=1 Tax=Rubrobacter naiadicus TaxID=1392641 RepID=UPI00235EE2B3|nr:glycine cleavage T C-terminal barrel domain-containing protein [Rubrobacter naiadicus]